jgi:alkylation response protein AidB-like acyl-CoA dehydrogenase
MIDFRPTEQQLAMKAAARKFAQTELKPLVKELEQVNDPWECFRRTRDVYRVAAKMGLTRGFIPEAYGGLGLGALDYAVAAEELVKVDLGVPSTILANGLALAPLIFFGSEAQKHHWLTRYCQGQDAEDGPYLATYGFTDVDGAANFDSMDPAAGFRTYARLKGDHYVINGAKLKTSGK